jgi:hypothetical protein
MFVCGFLALWFSIFECRLPSTHIRYGILMESCVAMYCIVRYCTGPVTIWYGTVRYLTVRYGTFIWYDHTAMKTPGPIKSPQLSSASVILLS